MFENAKFQIEITPSGIVTLVKLKDENAESHILTTFFQLIILGTTTSFEAQIYCTISIHVQ